MNLFYGHKVDNQFVLNDDEWHHLKNVLRTKIDDKILVADGSGTIWYARLKNVSSVETIQIESVFLENTDSVTELSLAVAPTKQIERIEWLLEKAVETGLANFYPVYCRHSERRKLNLSRLHKIALSASKQSLKPKLTRVHEDDSFSNFLQKDFNGQKYILSSNADKILKNELKPNMPALMLVGPEGDFHPTEIEMALQSGFVQVSLGTERMRTETAALYAAMAFHWTNK